MILLSKEYLLNLLEIIFLKPSLYTLKDIYPPIVSPNNEIINPHIGPKNIILAPVTNIDGITPESAINILINKEINKAKLEYSLKISKIIFESTKSYSPHLKNYFKFTILSIKLTEKILDELSSIAVKNKYIMKIFNFI